VDAAGHDLGARRAGHGVYFVAGRKFERETCRVQNQAWETYQACVKSANDMRGVDDAEYNPGRPDTETVAATTSSGQTVLATRYLARPYLHEGQPVWVRRSGEEITEIRLSYLWRYQGRTPERAGDSTRQRAGDYAPCTEPDALCPSCRLFGSADDTPRMDEEAVAQHSYRGHVRIGDAIADGDVTPWPWHLAPTGSPKPSAGQFYLDHRGVSEADRLAPEDERPVAAWGSRADAERPRPLRGRKFYWRTTSPTAGTPRGRATGRHAETQTAWVELIPQDTTFTFQVSVDNVDRSTLGGLIAALCPQLLWPDPDSSIVLSVGGGKPFGFGSVSTEVDIDRFDTAKSRYLGTPAPTLPQPADLVTEFAASVPAGTRGRRVAIGRGRPCPGRRA
jgi:CRISPR-associated protein (TIGR03986 family)